MVLARERAEWGRAALLATMLEGCRQNNAPIDPDKWTPPILRPPAPKRKPPSKEEIAAFREVLKAGRERT